MAEGVAYTLAPGCGVTPAATPACCPLAAGPGNAAVPAGSRALPAALAVFMTRKCARNSVAEGGAASCCVLCAWSGMRAYNVSSTPKLKFCNFVHSAGPFAQHPPPPPHISVVTQARLMPSLSHRAMCLRSALRCSVPVARAPARRQFARGVTGATAGGTLDPVSVSAPSAVWRSMRDVEDWVLTYGGALPSCVGGVRPLAVVKVGGEVIQKELPALLASLRALRSHGLSPVVIHGGGPQLNDELAKAGVQPEYIGGTHAIVCGGQPALCARPPPVHACCLAERGCPLRATAGHR
ncbi:hypothetical protein EON62_06365, partial [archaeon]